ncbi:MAG: hypothetical protein IKW92_00145 [Firmicutes bacterium]|nr:hypothetical protein [Bacillota bacterium]
MIDIRISSLENVKQFCVGLETEKGVFGPFMITAAPAFVEAAGYAG